MYKKYLPLIVFFVVLILISIPYFLGYRLGAGLKLQRVGTVVISGLPANASIFIDQSFYKTTSGPENTSAELMTGSHSIIVSVPGDFPWSTLTPVTSGKSTTIQPILITEQPNITTLTGTDAATATSTIASASLPSISNPLKLANGCADVYVSNNQIIAEATSSPGCTPPAFLCDAAKTCSPTIIFAPVAPLNAVLRFPKRQDALVVEFSKTLYALALDPRSPQFFAPILGATDPAIAALPDGTIVVENGTFVFKLNL